MLATTKKTGLLMPLNANTMAEYSTIFSSALQDPMQVLLYYCRMPDKCPHCADEEYSEVHDQFLRVADNLPTMAVDFGINAAVTVEHGLDLGPYCGWLLNIPWGRDWAVNGIYPQVGFRTYRPSMPSSEVAGVLVAMHNIDMHIAATKSSDPTVHTPFPTDQELVNEFDVTVGRLYRDVQGLWCEDLVAFRNMIMIKMRALLLRRDPDRVYDRFVQAGGTALVDHLVLG